MFDHVGVQVRDVEASTAFLLQVLAPLGLREGARFPTPGGPVVGLGTQPDSLPFWLSPVQHDGPGHELHLAFTAPDRDTVRAVFAAARAAGAEILHEPRVFPEYHEHYYGVFFRDLDGNNLEAVCHLPE